MSALGEQLDSYLALRRAVGYKLVEHARLLPGFIAELESRDEQVVTLRAATAWAGAATSQAAAARRLSLVRGFASYLSAFDAATEVPPARLLPGGPGRRPPYLYSSSEIGALMTAARGLCPEPWGASMATLIGLLAATGLRPGEAYRLERSDVDLDRGELAVLNSKFGKSRLLPLHPSTVEALRRYSALRDALVDSGEQAFLVSCSGRRIAPGQAAKSFRHLLNACSIVTGPGRRAPRLYDLRHGFAVKTLIDWHRRGLDVQRQLPVLSAYLGHLVPANTYWYLEAAPELLAIVAARVGTYLEDEG
jgi:integrase/recombinase XerD